MKNLFIRKILFLLIVFVILSLCINYSKSYAYNEYEEVDFKIGVVKVNNLNIRCGPGKKFAKVGSLKKGEHINVFAKSGNWYIIQTDSELIGAVSIDYIDKISNLDETNQATIYTNTNLSDNLHDVVAEEFSDELELTKEEEEFLNLINSNRVNNGLEELKVDSTIQNIARLKAADLEKNDYFSHNSPIYGNIDEMLKMFEVTYIDSGENIAGNRNLSGAVEAWMNSENHKANILNNNYNYTGVAVVDSKKYGKIFVEIFVRRS